MAGTLGEPSHLSSALTPHDALDAKVWYQLLFSASTPEHSDSIVRCAQLVASARFVGSTHRVDGPAAIGTEPRVWEESGGIPRF